MVAHSLFFAVVSVMHDDLTRGGIESHVGWALERWTLLHKVIGQESECAALRKDSCFLKDRTVLESEDKVRVHAITVGHLDRVTCRENVAIRCAQHEKAMEKPLPLAYRHGFRQQKFR